MSDKTNYVLQKSRTQSVLQNDLYHRKKVPAILQAVEEPVLSGGAAVIYVHGGWMCEHSLDEIHKEIARQEEVAHRMFQLCLADGDGVSRRRANDSRNLPLRHGCKIPVEDAPARAGTVSLARLSLEYHAISRPVARQVFAQRASNRNCDRNVQAVRATSMSGLR
jgi:hypothetical protein